MSTQLPENFDPENQEGNSWELLPVGEYVAQIVEATVLQPKTGDGFYIALTWKISEGPYEGRQVWQRVTFLHSSEQAQTIGRKTLKDLCNALGVNEHVEDVEVFLFKPAKIKVGVEKDKNGQYDDKNVVKRIMPLDEAPAQSAPPTPETAKPAAAKPAAKSQPATKTTARPAPAGQAPWHQG
jgi:hypothetical protein